VTTTTRGFGLLDLIVVLAVAGVLVWAVHLDWSRLPAPPAAQTAGH